MNCPKCEGASKVITTRNVKDRPGAKCRYRHCTKCRHRWYSFTPAEIALPDSAVHWSYDLIEVYHKEAR